MGKFFSCKGVKPNSKPKVDFRHLNDVPEEPIEPAKKSELLEDNNSDQDRDAPPTERGLLASLFGGKQADDNVD